MSRRDLYPLQTSFSPKYSQGLSITCDWQGANFYPYAAPGSSPPPVFAVTGGNYVLIYKCVHKKETDFDIHFMRAFKDPDQDVAFKTVAWSQDATGNPLICATGADARIKVFNVNHNLLVTTLSGHGHTVNEISVSPVNPYYLASASNDKSVRIWSLDPADRAFPTAVIARGTAAHDRNVLTIGWHCRGRYLLSGGSDTRLNLWAIPDNLHQYAGAKGQTDNTKILKYPHFASTEIHITSIDCVRFCGDEILSHAVNEDKITLWKIEGFDSRASPPAKAPSPPSQVIFPGEQNYKLASNESRTRSAWGHRFQRLLQFDLAGTADIRPIRFTVFDQPKQTPVLAAGNAKGKVLFWDWKTLEKSDIDREARSGVGGDSASNGKVTGTGIGCPFDSIKAHATRAFSTSNFIVRHIAFSPDREWGVACGDNGQMVIKKEKKKEPEVIYRY